MSTDEQSVGADGDQQEDETRIGVLHLDDDEAFLDVARAYLERRGNGIEVVTTTDPDEALAALAADDVDCVVSDYQMPVMNGLEFLEAVREDHPDLPFLLFTGKGSEEIAQRAISVGVTDYIRKKRDPDQFTVLTNRIENIVAQRRAERRAREADQRIRNVYERITDAVVAFDDEWRYTHANQQAETLLQESEAALLGERLWDVFPELEGSAFEHAFLEAMETQEPRTAEEYFAPLDTWFEVRAYPDEDGLSVYFRDVTERREQERRFDAIFDNTYQFTGLMEPDGTLLETNETALEFGGVDREDVVGQKIWDAYWFQLDDGTAERLREDVERAAGGEFVRYELDVQGADGVVTIDFSIRPLRNERGEVELLIPEGRDITRLKARERELRERERELGKERAFTETIFEALPDVFYAFDPQGNFLRWNDQLETVTGYTDEEIAEMNPTDFFAGEEVERIAEAIAEVIREDEIVTVEAELSKKSGETVPYEFTGAQLKDENGEVMGLVGIGRDVSGRKERERRFEAIFDNTYQFTGLMEPDGTLLEVNQTALEFGGIDREDVVGQKIRDAYWFQLDDETGERVRRGVERAAAGEFVRYELDVQGADGVVTIDFSIRPLRNERGEVELLIPEGRDITRLKARERELEGQKRYFKRLVAEVEEYAIFMLDPEGHVVTWNEGARRLKGYEESEILGEHVSAFYPPDAEMTPEECLERAVEQGSFEQEDWRVRKDGTRFWANVTLTPLYDDDGELTGFSKVTRDMTGRKERERRFDAIIDNTYQFTGLMEPDGTLLEVNEAALEFGGIDREDVVGRPFWETVWWSGDEERVADLRDAIDRAGDGEFVRYEVAIDGGDGDEVVDFSIKPVRGEHGEVVLLIPEGHVVTERKRREEELRAQNERLAEFTSVLSHDLRNRLGVAKGSLSLAAEEVDSPDVARATEAVERMEELLDDVLELAETGNIVDEPEPSLAREVLERAVRDVVADDGNVTVECPEDRRILADPKRLGQLVENLVNNAVKHAGTDATVRVELAGDTLTVEDDGHGIPTERREEVFEVGYTTGSGTSGFGLAIVKRIAEAHGWSVSVTDGDLGGARFEITGIDSP